MQPAPDLVVIGNIMARGNPELEYVLNEKIPYCSMPALLEREFIPGHTSIVVAGTHGKTTTTAMLAWIFHTAGKRPDFLIGGVAPNFGERSYGLGGGEEWIVEGDEYETAFFDRVPKFLHYHPDELILTSLEYDHADIYPDLASIVEQFRRLVNLVPSRGKILMLHGNAELKTVTTKAFCPVETFGLTPEADWFAGDIQWHDDATEFRVAHKGKEIARLRLPMVGKHNVLNALAATAIATAAAFPPTPSPKLSPVSSASANAWRPKAKSAASSSSKISRIIPPRFVLLWRPRARAGRGKESGPSSSRAPTPCAAKSSRMYCLTLSRSPMPR